jgi:hypothetical protein
VLPCPADTLQATRILMAVLIMLGFIMCTFLLIFMVIPAQPSYSLTPDSQHVTELYTSRLGVAFWVSAETAETDFNRTYRADSLKSMQRQLVEDHVSVWIAEGVPLCLGCAECDMRTACQPFIICA